MTPEKFEAVEAMLGKAEAAFADGRYSDAVDGFRWAADQGHPVAPWALGTMYVLACGVERDNDRVRYWYGRGEDWGHVYGDPASRARAAEGVSIPDADVVVWLRRAAEHHHAEAQYQLGRMHANGHGLPRDFAAAIKLYREAAEQGHAEAMRRIARMYFFGEGVARSKADGDLWEKRAEAAESAAGSAGDRK